jgi:hypothetical protein
MSAGSSMKINSLLLKIGVINATFKLSGIIPDKNDKLKICVKGLEISLAIIFIILALMPSYPELLFDFIFSSSISSSFSVIALRKRLD